MSIGGQIRRQLTPDAGRVAPGAAAKVLSRALDGAVHGIGPLRGAAAAADRARDKAHGTEAEQLGHALGRVIAIHVELAGAQGFVTNIGGLVTMAAAVPANVAGLALLQCRMVAAIAHLNGHDIEATHVREAILVCVLGPTEVGRLVKLGKLPGTPEQISDTAATASPSTSSTDAADSGQPHTVSTVVSSQIVTALVTRVVGRRAVTTLAKRVPLIGGAVGASTDAYATWRIGRYAKSEFRRHGAST